MSGPDMILGFIISYADGKLQEYMKPDLESLRWPFRVWEKAGSGGYV